MACSLKTYSDLLKPEDSSSSGNSGQQQTLHGWRIAFLVIRDKGRRGFRAKYCKRLALVLLDSQQKLIKRGVIYIQTNGESQSKAGEEENAAAQVQDDPWLQQDQLSVRASRPLSVRGPSRPLCSCSV